MSYLNKKIENKILYESYERFPTNTNKNGTITKIVNEPYSYWVDKTKMYIFENDKLFEFLTWYWHNYKESFLIDFCDIEYEIPWKYFCKQIPNFKEKYLTVEQYDSNIIQQTYLIEIYDKLVNVVGLDNFINDVILSKNKYKSMGFKKTNNVIYKFATNCGTQIFKIT